MTLAATAASRSLPDGPLEGWSQGFCTNRSSGAGADVWLVRGLSLLPLQYPSGAPEGEGTALPVLAHHTSFQRWHGTCLLWEGVCSRIFGDVTSASLHVELRDHVAYVLLVIHLEFWRHRLVEYRFEGGHIVILSMALFVYVCMLMHRHRATH